MKLANKILYGLAMCAAALTFGACSKTETVYIYPEQGVTRLTVYPYNVNIGYAEDVELDVTVRPADAEYEWISADPSVAVVEENHIIPKGVGSTVLTAKAGNKTFDVEVNIHSSIVGDFFFLQNGQTAKMGTVQVLPEGTAFEVSNQSENLMTVTGDLTVTALEAGVGRVTITTEDEQTKTVTVGITDGGAVTLSHGVEYLYDGGDLGHGAYGYSVLVFGSADAVYEGDAKWSGAGTGLAYNLYRDGFDEAAADGSYTVGTGDHNFFNRSTSSYVIDVASGTKEAIISGELLIEGNNVTANVITDSHAYIFKYSGSRPATKRSLQTDYTTVIDDDFCNGGGSKMFVDTGGTVFYGGYTYCWQLRLANNATNYLQLFMWGHIVLHGDYTLLGSWGGRGTVWTGVSTTTWGTRFQEGSTSYTIANLGGFSITNWVEGDGVNTMDVKGTIYGANNYSYTIPEIGETNSIPHTIEIDVKNLAVNVSSSRFTTN